MVFMPQSDKNTVTVFERFDNLGLKTYNERKSI